MIYFCLRHATCLLTAGLAMTCLGAMPGHAAPVSPMTRHRNFPDTFLPTPAQSVPALVALVQADPVVRRHYARYLNLPLTRVASYLRANVVPSRLGQGGLYTVYYVRPNGLIYPTKTMMAKGSPVFALRNGPALLTWSDGNPLVRCQQSVHYDPDRPAAIVRASTQVKPPIVEQVIVPTRVDMTVVPPAPAAGTNPAAH